MKQKKKKKKDGVKKKEKRKRIICSESQLMTKYVQGDFISHPTLTSDSISDTTLSLYEQQ